MRYAAKKTTLILMIALLITVAEDATALTGMKLSTDSTGQLLDDGSYIASSETTFTLTAIEPKSNSDVVYHMAVALYGRDTNVTAFGGKAWRTDDFKNVKEARLSFKLDKFQDGKPIPEGIYHLVYNYTVYKGNSGQPEKRGMGKVKVQLSNISLRISPQAHRPKNLNPSLAYNLVANGSIEKQDASNANQPEGYYTQTVGNGNAKNVKFAWALSGHTGKRSLSLDSLDVYLGYWGTAVPVKPDTEYAIGFYYKCKSVTPANYKGPGAAFREGRPNGPNLELGVVAQNAPEIAKRIVRWTDTAIPLGQRGGNYLPVATDWVSHQKIFKTTSSQTQLSVKLRMFCAIQKVWFDDLYVTEINAQPKIELVLPAKDAVLDAKNVHLQWNGPGSPNATTYFVQYSSSPLYADNRTQQIEANQPQLRIGQTLDDGHWYWRVGVPDQNGQPIWISQSQFSVGQASWIARDTTPPVVNLPNPVPNAKANDNVTVSAQFADGGSGIDIKSAKIFLDGVDVTGKAKMTESGFSLKPDKTWSTGAHQLKVNVSDHAGNKSNTLSWRFGVGESLRYRITFKEHQFLLNGEPYFPIGIWNYRCHPGDGRFIEGHLAAASAAGVDVVLNTIPPGMDMLHKHGIKSIQNITYDLKQIVKTDFSEEAAMAVLFAEGNPARGQAHFRDHPAILGYWGDDPENAENTNPEPIPPKTLKSLAVMRDVLKKYDPDHPLIFAISNFPRLKEGGKFADVLLSYRYAVPQYHPRVINPYTIKVVKKAFPEKPTMFLSQAMDLTRSDPEQYHDPGGIRPTVAETDAMTFYSLMCGISGYAFYANYLNEKETPQHWAGLLRTSTRLRYLADALAAREYVQTAELIEDSTFGSIYNLQLKHQGVHTMIAVNMSGGNVTGTWRFKKPTQVAVLFEDRLSPTKTSQMTDRFGPYEVHIYQW